MVRERQAVAVIRGSSPAPVVPNAEVGSARARTPRSDSSPTVRGASRGVRRCIAGSITEAVDQLAREGFVRSLEAEGFALWCPSCECSFAPGELMVQSVVAVGDAMVIALCDRTSGARGRWVLTERSERDAWVLSRLAWPPAACVDSVETS